MSIITIKEVKTEFVKKGKGGYSNAEVQYSDEKGEHRTKKLVSFTNPEVFDVIKDAKAGEQYDVVNKKEGDYWQWVSVSRLTSQSSAPKSTGGSYVDNRETADERRLKQLMIVRQSSIASALAFVNGKTDKDDYDTEAVLNIAQTFVDFVYGNDKALGAVDSEDQDIPY